MSKVTTSLTHQKTELQLSHARKQTKRLIELKEYATHNFLEGGKIFKDVKENNLWELEGAHSFNSYIAEIGYDRTTAFKMILVYETFGTGTLVDSNQQLLEAGWTKLAKVAPYTDDRNYEAMVELVTSNSISDIDKELFRQNYITRKEVEPETTECPFCHKTFTKQKRVDQSFPREDYNRVIEVYQEAKDTKFEGKEYDPIMQSIKTMFTNGRTPEQIIAVIKHLEDAEYSWTINTVKNKIAEILPEIGFRPKKELSEQDQKLARIAGDNV